MKIPFVVGAIAATLWPGVPSHAQSYPSRPVRVLVGFAPGGGIIDMLCRGVAEILKTRDVRERFTASGTDVVGSSPKEFAEQIRRELEQNKKVIKAVGMKAD